MSEELMQRERVMMAVLNRPRAVMASIGELVKEGDEAMAFIRRPITPLTGDRQAAKAA